MEPSEIVVDLNENPADADTLGDHDTVLAALAQHFTDQGHDTHQLWVSDLEDGSTGMFDLYVPDLNLLCEVETVDTLISLDPARPGAWRTAGFEVWVVVPAAKLGAAERRLRGAVDRIVPWTVDGSKYHFDLVHA